MADIYLASRSPRRRELLHQIGVRFETLLLRVAPNRGIDVDESQHPGESAADFAVRVATETVVVLNGEVLGKPDTREQAAGYLKRLSGQTHEVLTAVALAASPAPNAIPFVVTSTSRVRLRPLSVAEIERYCATNEPLDKAGGYAIQGRAAIFVEQIDGSYSGVVGLPLFETAALLERAGVRVL
jgi:septum formation protein